MAHREFKRRIYPEFARIAHALASDKRLELIDLLAQAPRHVEALAEETAMTVANVSQHLQVLRSAHLVEAERDGNKVVYRLCGGDVLELWLGLRAVAEYRLPEVRAIVEEFAVDGAGEPVPAGRLAADPAAGAVTLLDVRPTVEYEAGHLPGAISIPPNELEERMEELPRGRPVVAYCRGRYCLFADDAVALLRQHGFEAYRLEGGWSEWVTSRDPGRNVPPAGLRPRSRPLR